MESNTSRVTIRLREETRAKLKRMAAKDDRKENAYVRRILEKHVEANAVKLATGRALVGAR